MTKLLGKSAVITGASQGIGQAIAAALHDTGVRLALLGRSRERLKASVSELQPDTAPAPVLVEADLNDADSLDRAAGQILAEFPAIEILVHCGGSYYRGQWDEAAPKAFNDILRTNVVGPYTLTRLLLPQLTEARGDIVFINSSITRSPGIRAGHYKATKHALQAMSDSLRAEINEKGIRVLSVFPGRTATPLQEYIHADEQREYCKARLLQPVDVARAVVSCLSLADTAEVTDIYIRPRYKS